MKRSNLIGVALLLIGGACAYLASFIGYATSATNTYGWLLRRWAELSALAVWILLTASWLGPRWVRVAALVVVAGTVMVGVGPAARLLHLGWAAP